MSRKVKTTHLQIKSVKNAKALGTDEDGNLIKVSSGSGKKIQEITAQNQKQELENNQVNNILYFDSSNLIIVINLASIKEIGDSITVVNVQKNMEFILGGGVYAVYDTAGAVDRKGTISGFSGSHSSKKIKYYCLSKVITKTSETNYLIH
ncbi:hypothetical protein [Tenacibaculum finnmarkense]|uniref:hypothetical protein n=1 Tax=Tenacibaculum finnmarkense TaxID=2781243 RepID=UPI00187B94C0|nr:hypothetical protein [Tenacibaculum finnmarkense]MBE7693665.1 hypothetical protein [Tenacibaculum finnmarkense genomovar finnmarkense]